MKYTVNVTQEDIDKGKKGSCSQCPVALAGIRSVGKSFYVGPTMFAFRFNWIAELPKCVVDFIERFDSGQPVQPFTFDIEIP